MRTSDAHRVAQLCGDPAVARMMLRAPLPYLPIAAEGWIWRSQRANRWRRTSSMRWSGRRGLIGCIGAHKTPAGSFEIGYWFGQPYRGRGTR